MKILITGGNGYIAKSLTTALRDECEVTSVTRLELDLLDAPSLFDFFQGKYFDVIIHTATRGGSRLVEEDESVERDNISMCDNLLQLKEYYGRLILFGSGAELQENLTPYGRSKREIRKKVSNKDFVTMLRIYAVFDDKELDTRFIKANLKRYISRQPLEIHQNKLMDFIFMKDLVSIIKVLIFKEIESKEIDCVYLQKISLEKIAEFINTLGDYQVPIKVEKEGMAKSYVGIAQDLPIHYQGLFRGIEETYNKLLHAAD